MWPICLDAFLILASIYILRADMKGESTLIGWITLITFTGVSVIFNIQRSSSIISMATHAVPPVSLCVSLELLMQMFRGMNGEATMVIREEQPPDRSDQIRQYLINHPDVSLREAGDYLKCSPATVQRYRKQLQVMSSGGE
jgi:hypothetical protein